MPPSPDGVDGAREEGPAEAEGDAVPPPPDVNFWGSSPSEDDYYASHGVRGHRAFFTGAATSLRLFCRSWEPLDGPPRAALCMVHGYGNDTSWTFQATAIALAARARLLCLALDLPSHGRSAGLPAFVPDLRPVLRDLVAFFSDPPAPLPSPRGLPRFLYGESMGGALCLLLHLDNPGAWCGAVLVAPMCRIADSLRPSWPIPQVLTALARVLPTFACVPSGDLLEKSVKVPEKKVIAAANPRRYAGRPRLGTVVELLRVTDELHSRLSEVTMPFLVLHGSADVVTDPAVSRELHEKARSKHKSIKIYDGMMHSLLFGEPDENVELVRGDILDWLLQRIEADDGEAAQEQDKEKASV